MYTMFTPIMFGSVNTRRGPTFNLIIFHYQSYFVKPASGAL